MPDDPLFMAELAAEKREREDAAWRAQYADLKRREAWHEMDTDHDDWPFAECPSLICRGEMPVPGIAR